MLTGDTILGRGTTVIAHPDGALGPYLGSLRRLAELAAGTAVLPGHGPELPDAPAAARALPRAPRGAPGPGARRRWPRWARTRPPRQVVELVYADVDQVLWPAAELSVRAQLDYLRGP